jgi:hypothetical protein
MDVGDITAYSISSIKNDNFPSNGTIGGTIEKNSRKMCGTIGNGTAYGTD